MAGTFYARESVSVLYNFVREALRDDWLPFELLGPGGLKLTDENLAFNECGLVSEKNIVGTFQSILRLSESSAAQSWGRSLSSFRAPSCSLSPHFKHKQSRNCLGSVEGSAESSGAQSSSRGWEWGNCAVMVREGMNRNPKAGAACRIHPCPAQFEQPVNVHRGF